MKSNQIKRAIQEVAYEKRLNMTQIKSLMRSMGVRDLHVNGLVCARCGKKCGEVGRYNTCDSCEPLMKKAEKQARLKQLPTYEEDFKCHLKPTLSSTIVKNAVVASFNSVMSRRLI